MIVQASINNERYQVALDDAKSIAIPLDFEGEQPNHFGAPAALSAPIKVGNFVGDTRAGSSCNCDAITLTPHCVGTHTESIGHILNDRLSVSDCLHDSLIPCTLITIEPILALDAKEQYQPVLDENDKVISFTSLQKAINQPAPHQANEFLQALVVRTTPNPVSKKNQNYNLQHQAPFFTHEAMQYICDLGIQHILVDTPSIDRMYDDGLLSNHRKFWHVAANCKQRSNEQQSNKTITEMIYVNDKIKDGHYVLNLQCPRWKTDAVPSQPLLYPITPLEN